MATGAEWSGHVPGPNGLPGGYPVRFDASRIDLDLPAGLGCEEAVAWNTGFEAGNGLVVENGRAHYTGRLYERLRQASPTLAKGFTVTDIDAVYDDMVALRTRLQSKPALD
jgi:hypothetical protein